MVLLSLVPCPLRVFLTVESFDLASFFAPCPPFPRKANTSLGASSYFFHVSLHLLSSSSFPSLVPGESSFGQDPVVHLHTMEDSLPRIPGHSGFPLPPPPPSPTARPERTSSFVPCVGSLHSHVSPPFLKRPFLPLLLFLFLPKQLLRSFLS